MRFSIPLRFWMAVVIAAICLFVSPGWAAENAKLPREQKMDQEGGSPPLPVKKVTIEKKTRGTVITNVGDVYQIDLESIIVGTDGKQVSMRDLQIPCDVEITYTTRKDGLHAERIKIERISSNASSHWTAMNPE
jgi:hypothetical protein